MLTIEQRLEFEAEVHVGLWPEGCPVAETCATCKARERREAETREAVRVAVEKVAAPLKAEVKRLTELVHLGPSPEEIDEHAARAVDVSDGGNAD